MHSFTFTIFFPCSCPCWYQLTPILLHAWHFKTPRVRLENLRVGIFVLLINDWTFTTFDNEWQITIQELSCWFYPCPVNYLMVFQSNMYVTGIDKKPKTRGRSDLVLSGLHDQQRKDCRVNENDYKSCHILHCTLSQQSVWTNLVFAVTGRVSESGGSGWERVCPLTHTVTVPQWYVTECQKVCVFHTSHSST